MRDGKKRGVSAGTVFMLALTVCVLGATAYILPKLSSGAPADLSSLKMQTLSIRDGREGDPGPEKNTAPKTEVFGKDGPENTPEPVAPRAGREPDASFTLTAGGTVSVDEAVRRSGYSDETKKYDFSDISGLIRNDVASDISVVFLENVLYDDVKYSKNTVPGGAAVILKEAGFDTVAAGFSEAWERSADGVVETTVTLKEHGLACMGVYPPGESPAAVIRDVNGARVALLQYTDNMSASTRKKMVKDNAADAVPDASPERIAADIAAAREKGAQVVAVFLNWGRTGAKEPDKKQKELAQKIADAGADLIIGAGSHVAQRAEYLSCRTDGDGTRKVLCVYSLGTLLDGYRKSTARLGGYLVKLRISVSGGVVSVDAANYIPDYVWHYRQDGKDYYRCVALDRAPPDGIDADNTKAMGKTLEYVKKVLDGTPLLARE